MHPGCRRCHPQRCTVKAMERADEALPTDTRPQKMCVPTLGVRVILTVVLRLQFPFRATDVLVTRSISLPAYITVQVVVWCVPGATLRTIHWMRNWIVLPARKTEALWPRASRAVTRHTSTPGGRTARAAGRAATAGIAPAAPRTRPTTAAATPAYRVLPLIAMYSPSSHQL